MFRVVVKWHSRMFIDRAEMLQHAFRGLARPARYFCIVHNQNRTSEQIEFPPRKADKICYEKEELFRVAGTAFTLSSSGQKCTYCSHVFLSTLLAVFNINLSWVASRGAKRFRQTFGIRVALGSVLLLARTWY
jgi:hypothetical protein